MIQGRTPTYTHDFAKLHALLEGEYWGQIYGLRWTVTSFEVATELIRLLGVEGEVKLTPVGSDFFKETYFAERPPCERLVNRKLNIRGLNLMRDWKVALKDYIDHYYQGYLN